MAWQDSLPLFDLETLHLQLPAAHCYVADGVHPHGALLVTVYLNLVLNMYDQGSSIIGSGEVADA